jgi:hypothetical protein
VKGFPLCGGTSIVTDAAMSSPPKDVKLYPWIGTPTFFAAFFKTRLLLIVIVAQGIESLQEHADM